MTEDDVRAMIAESMDQHRGMTQWLVRAAFEEAWKMSGGDPVQSSHDQEPVGWRAAWMKSAARNMLVRNNMISGGDTWK